MQNSLETRPRPRGPQGDQCETGAMASHPSNIGAYTILALLGVGGMGRVYLARDRSGKQVALKVLLQELTAATLDRLRFEREFDIASRLDHPGLVRVYDRFFQDDLCYYSMEFVQGVDFARYFQTGPQAANSRTVSVEALELFAQLAGAVNYLHEHNILHRDLKSENVLVDGQKKTRLLDFGLACFHKLVSKANRITSPGMVLGTPYAMAPEQIVGESADERTDLYSLGVMLYQIFCQKLPFDAPDPMAVLYQILNQPVPPFAPRFPVPPGLEELVLQLLSKEPHQRPRDAAEVEQRLRALASNWGGTLEPIAAKPAQREQEPLRKLAVPRPVGRKLEHEWFESRLEQLLDGRGAWTLLWGASGVGKSFLLQQWANTAKAHAITAVKVQPVGGSRIPYQLWTPILRWAIHEQNVPSSVLPFVPVLSLLLPELGAAPASMDDPLQRYHLFEGMARLILHRCQSPAVLLLDQIHEADPASLEFLHYLLETRYYGTDAVHLPLLVLSGNVEEGDLESLRGLAERQPCGVEFSLGGFTPEESAEFLDSLLDHQKIDRGTLDFLYQETEGKPLYLLELARLGVEGGAWDWQEGGWHFRPPTSTSSLGSGTLRLPARLQKAIRQRLEGLDELPLEVLRMSAVLGPLLQFQHLQALCGLADRNLYEICSQLVGKRLLVEREDFELASRGTVEVVLETMTWGERRGYHARAAAYLEQLPDADHWEVGQHWAMAGQPERSGQAYLIASQNALRSYAYEEALRCLHELSQLPPKTQPVTHDELDELWSDAYLGAGFPQKSEERLKAIIGAHQDLLVRVRRLRKLGTAQDIKGDLTSACETFKKALELMGKCKNLNAEQNGALLDEGNRLCERQLRVLFLLRPKGWAEEFTALVMAQFRLAFKGADTSKGRNETWAQAFIYGGFWSLRKLKWAGGARLSIKGAARRLSSMPETVVKARLLGDSGYLLLMAGSTRMALTMVLESQDILQRLGVVNALSRTHLQLAAIYFHRGCIGMSAHHCQQGLSMARRLGNPFEEVLALSQLAYSKAALGQMEEAREAMASLIPLRQQFKASYMDLIAELAQCYYLWGSNNPAQLVLHARAMYEQCKRNQEVPYNTLHFGLLALDGHLSQEQEGVKFSAPTLALLADLDQATRGQRIFRAVFKRMQARALYMQGLRGRAFEIIGECTRRAELANIPWERYCCHSMLAEWLKEEGLGEHHALEASKASQEARSTSLNAISNA